MLENGEPELNIEGEKKQKKARGGRPKSSPESLKNHHVGVRFTQAEKSRLDQEFPHGELSQYMRACALGKLGTAKLRKTVPELSREAWIELSRPLSNLNQLAHRVNSGEAVDSVEIVAKIEDCRKMIVALRSQLLGADDGDR